MTFCFECNKGMRKKRYACAKFFPRVYLCSKKCLLAHRKRSCKPKEGA